MQVQGRGEAGEWAGKEGREPGVATPWRVGAGVGLAARQGAGKAVGPEGQTPRDDKPPMGELYRSPLGSHRGHGGRVRPRDRQGGSGSVGHGVGRHSAASERPLGVPGDGRGPQAGPRGGGVARAEAAGAAAAVPEQPGEWIWTLRSQEGPGGHARTRRRALYKRRAILGAVLAAVAVAPRAPRPAPHFKIAARQT